SGLGVAARALQALLRAKSGGNHLGLVIRLQIRLNVWFFLGVGRANRIGSGLGALERVRHSQGNVLAVVANDVVFERRAPLFADAFDSLSRGRTEDFSHFLPILNVAQAWHPLGVSPVTLDCSSI